jgi:hypothetical protein
MTVIPDRYNFTIWKGGTFYESITVYTDEAGSVPRNLTGSSIRMKITRQPKGDTLLDLSTSNGKITTDPTNGKIFINLTAEETAALKWKQGYYELSITDNPNVDVILHGYVDAKDQ